MTEDIAARFRKDTAEHAMVVLHDQGLYRHIRFHRPSPHSWAYWFDLITVPGVLIFRGDGESFAFSRVDDMFEFFRGPVGRINEGYWAQKVTSNQDRIRRYDRALLQKNADEAVAEAVEAAAGGLLAGLRDAVRQLVVDELTDDESVDRRLCEQFQYWANPADEWAIPSKRPDFQFVDVWEWDCREYDWWFLWACHAIVWGIAQYDAVKTSAVA